MSVPSSPCMAVVVTCHSAYLPWLPGCLDSINTQGLHGVQKILILDGCEAPMTHHLDGWEIVKGNWRDPNAGRNVALAKIESEWVAWVDADNCMPAGYLKLMRRVSREASLQVAMLYPDVIRVTAGLRTETVFQMPEWDFWLSRERSMVDTSSVWRVRAIREVGGWVEGIGMLDDYSLALKISRAGWTGQKVTGIVSVLRQHGERRSGNREAMPEACWRTRSLAVVTLCSGRASFWRVLDWLKQENLGTQAHLYWVDDSNDEAFHGHLHGAAHQLQRAGRCEAVTILRSRLSWSNLVREPRELGVTDQYWAVHRRVAALYNQVLSGLQEDVVLLVEDDVVPPAGAARQLCEPLLPFTRVAAVGAVYPSRDHPHLAVASGNKERWKDVPRMHEVPQALTDIGMIAGGCTVWNNAILRKVLPMQVSEGLDLGWDGTVCRRANEMGYQFLLDGRLQCQHLCGNGI